MAGLRWLYPEQELTFDTCWELFLNDNRYYPDMEEEAFALRDAALGYLSGTTNREVLEKAIAAIPEKKEPLLNNTWMGFRDALWKAYHQFGRLEIFRDMVEVHRNERETGCDPWPERDATTYCRRLEGWLRSGYVAWAECDHDGKGPAPGVLEDGRLTRNSIDHFWLFDGVRRVYVRHFGEDGEFHHGGWHYELHVVDSATTDRTGWHVADDFIRRHGSGAWWLARRERQTADAT